jgi:hypothetical protein
LRRVISMTKRDTKQTMEDNVEMRFSEKS